MKKILSKAQEPIRFSGPLGNDAKKLLPEIAKLGLEGLIGKRAGSGYEAGRRSGAWVKIKCQQVQEFVIGGYTPPGGTRTHFGALLIGYYKGGKLVYGGKVGTGFDQKLLAMLHAKLRKLEQRECPFATKPEEKKCHWVKPALVAQIRFTEWTTDGRLRHPAFLGMREDKSPRQVKRET